MMEHLYGEFTQDQIKSTKESLRKSIFFLLVRVEEDMMSGNKNNKLDVNKNFKGLLLKIGGMNQLLKNQPELVTVMSLLQAALMEYNSISFDFKTYRKLILDAGAEVNRLKEV